MALLIDRFWLPLLLAGLIGIMIGWATCGRGHEGRSWMSSWLPLGILAAMAGTLLAVEATVPGRYGMWLETALMMFAVYLAGCCISCFIHGLMFGPPRAAERDPNAEIVARKNAGVNSMADERRERERLQAMAATDATAAVKSGSDDHSLTAMVTASGAGIVAAANSLTAGPAPGPQTGAAASSSATSVTAVTTGGGEVGVKPPLLNRPRNGQKDDLTLIWGVAEKLEERMNGVGIWHFDQIAAWTPEHVKWFEHTFEGFKGRLVRDKWIEQCGKMAKGWRPENKVGTRPKN